MGHIDSIDGTATLFYQGDRVIFAEACVQTVRETDLSTKEKDRLFVATGAILAGEASDQMLDQLANFAVNMDDHLQDKLEVKDEPCSSGDVCWPCLLVQPHNTKPDGLDVGGF